MSDAIDIVAYCAEIDPQAERVLDILTRFSEVVSKWTKDHTYEAPNLADDLSCLNNHTATSAPPSEHTTSGHATTSFGLPAPTRLVNVSDPGLLTPPTIPKLPLLDILSSRPPSAVLGARVNGLSPPFTKAHPVSLVGARPSVSAHSSTGGSEPLSGNEFEFEFDGLWNSFINHLPPVSTVAPGITSLSQFPPPVIGTPTEPFGKYSGFPEPRVHNLCP